MQGWYGKAPAEVDAQLQRRAVGKEELIEERPANLIPKEFSELRKELGDLAESEEDVLTYAMFPDLGRQFLEQREAGTLEPEQLLPEPKSGRTVEEGVATEFIIDVHGETYQVAVTGVGKQEDGKRRVYLTLDGMPEEVVFQPTNAYVSEGGDARQRASRPGHVTTTMPGNIVEVLVQVGDKVEAGRAVLITEAMKMETEIHATISGTVKEVHVAKGDRVTPGEVLIEITEG